MGPSMPPPYDPAVLAPVEGAIPQPPGSSRTRPDACPGALTLHQAADGLLARIRVPGGVLSATALIGLAELSAELGDGRLELTSRANLQLRGLDATAATELATRLQTLGLLPSLAHERVRNILGSPLSGLDGLGQADTIDLVQSLDRELCANVRLAELPGRFLFGVDDGRGDIAAAATDVTLIAISASKIRLWPGDFAVDASHAVTVALALAEAFLDERNTQTDPAGQAAWRIADLVDGPRLVARRALHRLRARGIQALPSEPALGVLAGFAPEAPLALGVAEQRNGLHSLTVQIPLGRLLPEQAQVLAEISGRRGIRITPWRSIVATDVADPVTAAESAHDAGLGTEDSSPWLGVTACAGRPGCAKALADVQHDARAVAMATRTAAASTSLPVHWSGCSRRCGRPAGASVDVLATASGYQVSDGEGRTHQAAGVAELASTVEALRRG
ncbi:MAG: precorrin-3B synthase [Pseudonocardiales bacterium]|nr:precorrin-3B synthase [Pseudonocardiales bacterium]